MSDLPDPSHQSVVNAPTDSSVVSPLQPPPVQPSGGGVHKEVELGRSEPVAMEAIGEDVEIAPELETIGVEKRSETVELPPSISQLGVQAVGHTQPVVTKPTVQLPLTDDQIIQGLHAQIITSLRWLAEWCIKRLKLAHIYLKSTKDGVVVREIE